jgi:hypothetical protein
LFWVWFVQSDEGETGDVRVYHHTFASADLGATAALYRQAPAGEWEREFGVPVRAWGAPANVRATGGVRIVPLVHMIRGEAHAMTSTLESVGHAVQHYRERRPDANIIGLGAGKGIAGP